MKRIFKSNIRETSANKLTLFSLLMQEIIRGKKVVSEKGHLAKKEIKEMLMWLEKRAVSPKSVRKQAIDKLKTFENILERIIDDKPISVAEAQGAIKDVELMTNWLDKRKYSAFTKVDFSDK